MADMMNKTINSIVTALIAVVLIGAAFIPTALNVISEIPEAGAKYGTLLGVVITITIVGVLIGVIRSYMGRERDYEDE